MNNTVTIMVGMACSISVDTVTGEASVTSGNPFCSCTHPRRFILSDRDRVALVNYVTVDDDVLSDSDVATVSDMIRRVHMQRF